MAYEKFEKYDFYTKPQPEDFDFTKHMVAQTAAQEHARRAEDKKAKKDQKSEAVKYTSNGSYANDQELISRNVGEIRDEMFENEGRDTPQTLRKKTETETVSALGKLHKIQEQALIGQVKEEVAKNPLIDETKAFGEIDAAVNHPEANHTNREERLNNASNTIRSYKMISPVKAIASFGDKFKDAETKFGESVENPNTGITNGFTITTKAPFQSPVRSASGELIGYKPEVTNTHVDAFIKSPGGHETFQQKVDYVLSDPNNVTKLETDAKKFVASQLPNEDPNSQRFKEQVELYKGSAVEDMAKEILKEDLTVYNNARALKDVENKQTFQETSAQKAKGDTQKDVPIVTLNTEPGAIKIQASGLNSQGKSTGKTQTRDFRYGASMDIDSKNPQKPFELVVENKDLQSLDNSRKDIKKQGTTNLIMTKIVHGESADGKNAFYGLKDPGKRGNFGYGYSFDQTKLKNDGLEVVGQEVVRRNDGKVEKFKGSENIEKYKNYEIVSLDDNDFERLSKQGLDVQPYLQEVSKYKPTVKEDYRNKYGY